MSQKLLVCVCFHYSEEKLPHFCSVLDNFIRNYPESDIVIDTNSHQSEKAVLERLGNVSRVSTVVHNKLAHPFHLAWAHRSHFKREIESYDVFMYTEDDIWIPRENYLNYLGAFEMMWPEFIPSFVRTEEKDGVLYCADAFIRTRIGRSDLVEIGGRRFVTLDNPYHAFWIMPREALKKSMNANFERIYEGKKWIREIAASYGLAPGSCPYACWGSYDIQKKGLVEVDNRLLVSPLCRVRHMTNKYINDHAFNFGKIRLDRLIKKQAMML